MVEPPAASEAHRQPPIIATVVLFVLVFMIVGLTAGDVGLTYDERIYAALSVRVRQWLELLVDGNVSYCLSENGLRLHWPTKDHHPGVVKLVAAVFTPVSQPLFGDLGAYRAPTALFFATLCAALFRFLFRYGWMAAVFGVGSLCTMPRVFGHAHLLTMDIPVATMSFLTVAAFLRATEERRWRWSILFGVAFGLALGCKLNAFFVPLVLLIWWSIFHRRDLVLYIIAACVVAPAVFVLTWPALWRNTLSVLGDYLYFHLTHYYIPVDYMGRTYVDPPAPWHYPFVMTAITTPLLALASWALGLWRGLVIERGRDKAFVLLLMNATVQFLAIAMPGVPKYNGIRLFISAFPYLCAIGGMGVGWALGAFSERVGQHAAMAKIAGPKTLTYRLLPLMLLVPGVWSVGKIHPYWLSYYNLVVGGVPGAVASGYESTYWGESYAPALSWLFEHAPPSSVVVVAPVGVLSTIVNFYKGPTVRPDMRFSADEGELKAADYFMFHTRRGEISEQARRLLDNGRPVLAITHDGTPCGAPLCVIYDKAEVHRLLDGETMSGIERGHGEQRTEGQ